MDDLPQSNMMLGPPQPQAPENLMIRVASTPQPKPHHSQRQKRDETGKFT